MIIVLILLFPFIKCLNDGSEANYLVDQHKLPPYTSTEMLLLEEYSLNENTLTVCFRTMGRTDVTLNREYCNNTLVTSDLNLFIPGNSTGCFDLKGTYAYGDQVALVTEGGTLIQFCITPDTQLRVPSSPSLLFNGFVALLPLLLCMYFLLVLLKRCSALLLVFILLFGVSIHADTPRQEIDPLIDEGIELIATERWENAQHTFEEALIFSRQAGYSYGEAEALHYLGIIQRKCLNYQEAENLQIEALAVLFRLKKSFQTLQMKGNCCNELSVIYQHTGIVHKSLEYGERAIVYFRETNDLEKLTDALINCAVSYILVDDLEEAKKRAEEAFILQRGTSIQGMAKCLNIQGHIDYLLQSYDSSQEKFEKSLKYSREFKNRSNEMASSAFLGIIHAEKQEFDCALEYFESSLEIAHELNNVPMEMELHGAMALTLVENGNYSKAAEEYSLLADMYTHNDLLVQYYQCLSALHSAEAASQSGHHKEAGDLFMQASTMCHELYNREIIPTNKKTVMFYAVCCEARAHFEWGLHTFEQRDFAKWEQVSFEAFMILLDGLEENKFGAEETNYIHGCCHYLLFFVGTVHIQEYEGASPGINPGSFLELSIQYLQGAARPTLTGTTTLIKKGYPPLDLVETEYVAFLRTMTVSDFDCPVRMHPGETRYMTFTIAADPLTVSATGDNSSFMFYCGLNCSGPIRLDAQHPTRQVKIPLTFRKSGKERCRIIMWGEDGMILDDLSIFVVDESFPEGGYVEIEVCRSFTESVYEHRLTLGTIAGIFIALMMIMLVHKRY